MAEESAKPEPVSITIDAAAAHPDILSVQDAMRQVLDFFDLLMPDDEEGFLWNLKLASKNSPLTVVGEAYSILPGADVRAIAYEQKNLIEESFLALAQGRYPKRRLTTRRRDTIKRIFKRNLNGIGRSALDLGGRRTTVLVTPSIAALGVETLAEDEATDFQSLLLKDRARSEVGSVEGTLLDVGTDYHSPAVLICERNTGQEVWCRISADVRDRISAEMTLNDVWSRCRIRVRGRIRYNSDGSFKRIWASDLTPMKQRLVETSEITDTSFTSGNTVHAYLERLREGSLD